jgi:L-aminopeptidase/D-esterase-like protein
VRRGDLVVGALAVVNAFGDVRDGSGSILAGARRDGAFIDTRSFLSKGGSSEGRFARPGANTTLVVVGTNARLDQVQLAEVAAMAVDALTRRVTPAGTQFDGDMVFAVSTALLPDQSPVAVELLAQEATAMAIERAVRLAKGTPAIPGLADATA